MHILHSSMYKSTFVVYYCIVQVHNDFTNTLCKVGMQRTDKASTVCNYCATKSV